MKKIVVFLFVLTLIFISNQDTKKVIIPQNSIRYRIIANSNKPEDQKLKWDINAELIPIISEITKTTSNINDSRKLINKNLDLIEQKIQKYTSDYEIVFGENYFPEKEYQSIVYQEGDYESLVIKLGGGSGDNWWCVLFPPLCLIEAEKDNLEDITYTSYIKQVINKYF